MVFLIDSENGPKLSKMGEILKIVILTEHQNGD